jgi:hypothetical protein
MSYQRPKNPFPGSNNCFLCNQTVRHLEQDYEIAVSFGDELPRGAKRPSGFLWVHAECARKAAHSGYDFPDDAS